MGENARLKRAVAIADNAGTPMTKESQKKRFLREMQYHQLQLAKEVSILDPYEAPEKHEVPDIEMTLLAYLLRQQNQTLMSDKPVLLDFKAPLEIDLILLNDLQV